MSEWTLFGFIPAAMFAVDIFFYLSGFLTFYLLADKFFEKGLKILQIPMIYLHRYLRLIFPIIFVTMFCMWIFRYLGNGFSWDYLTSKLLGESCAHSWWSTFIFFNNFYPWDFNKACINWTWYLANDFQFFLISVP